MALRMSNNRLAPPKEPCRSGKWVHGLQLGTSTGIMLALPIMMLINDCHGHAAPPGGGISCSSPQVRAATDNGNRRYLDASNLTGLI